MNKRILSKILTIEYLTEHHYVLKKTIQDIGLELGYSAQAIFYHGKKQGFLFLSNNLKKGRSNPSYTKFKKGDKPWNYGIKGYKLDNKPNPQPKGSDHWNWKGNGSDRYKSEYKVWRKSVYERDNYTCQGCGIRGCKLNAHHIKEWCNYKELRFDVDNGVTLCHDCHKKTHNYGNTSRIKSGTIKIV